MILFIFLFYPFLSDARQEKHFLHYTFTVMTKEDPFPVFSAVVVSDDIQIKHYSNEERLWIRSSLPIDKWINAPPEPPESRDWFLHQLNTLSNRTDSQCSELHVLQRIIGCELEKRPDGSVNLRAFDEYGFDGEEFIAFNSDTLQWIDKNPKAKETKIKWNRQTERNQLIKKYLKTCTDWISTFHSCKMSSPNIRVFAKDAPDDQHKQVLTCVATGFYPRDIEMNIRLNQTILKDQIYTEIRPNDDGTFQMRTSVETDRNHKGYYDCLVNHSSLTKPVLAKWDGAYFDTETESQWPVIVGVAAVVVAGLGLLCWFCLKFQKVSSNSTSLFKRNFKMYETGMDRVIVLYESRNICFSLKYLKF
ncbi:H-2 class I histocompatibility antigen, K-B alpha chain-like isoform X2 [Onychostoma macrolepis]|uniref:H-2 class I histocompatibility antigen, K-B alpha chain-like isoform X2 n=1 Tax=Onychostoma macrolepis TaxID=369639 RepID=UPI00272CE71F|nr:H-2 class I histocompatibility antigen, K-B alpha chain-like isoform X2 [Onychostoma macrolepis]